MITNGDAKNIHTKKVVIFEAPTLYMCTLLLFQTINFLLFFLTTLLHIQDVPRGAKTHLGAAHTHFESCYAPFGLRTDTA